VPKWSLVTYQHCRPARAKVVVLLVLALVLTVPAGVARGDGTWKQVNTRTAEPVATASVRSGEVPPLPGMFQCSGENPCQFPPGRYVLTLGEIIPGLRLRLPPGWSSHENDPGELNLTPDQSGNELLIWVDMGRSEEFGSWARRNRPD
jgi:hypothetical protein